MPYYLVDIILPVLSALFFAHVAFVLGAFLIRRVGLLQSIGFVESLPLSVLVGYGVLGSVSTVLLLAGPLHAWMLWGLSIIAIFLLHRDVAVLYGALWARRQKCAGWAALQRVLVAGAAILIFFYLSTALVPPYQTDALAYHLPEVITMASKGIHFPIDGNSFYGNVPKLVESLYTFLYVLSGSFTLIHLIHFQIVLCLMFFVYFFLKKSYGPLTGMLAVLGILGSYEFMMLANSAYIDGVVTAFELVAVLLFFRWVNEPSDTLLGIIGLLYGFALASKYLALYGLLIIFLSLVSYSFYKRETWRIIARRCMLLCTPIVLIAGFWYIKNFVLYHNPFYPFIFGHQGISDFNFQAINLSVHEFMPRTVRNFLLFPKTLLLNISYLPLFFSFLLLPACIFIKKNVSLLRLLAIFGVLYTTMWFFVISHQVRFGMVGFICVLMVSSILLGIVLRPLDLFVQKHIKLFYGAIILVFLAGMFIVLSGVSHIGFLKGKTIEWRYIVGSITAQEYYQARQYGNLYAVSEFINAHYSNTVIINNFNATDVLLKNNNHYINTVDSFPAVASWKDLCVFLADQHVSFLYDDAHLRALRSSFVDAPNKGTLGIYEANPWFEQVRRQQLSTTDADETLIKQHSDIVFAESGATLYGIHTPCNQ